MGIVHNKISGQSNTSSSLIGGADWDEEHVYGQGSFFPLGLIRMEYDYAGDWCQNVGSVGVYGGWSRSGGQFQRELNATPPIRSGMVVVVYAVAIRVSGLPSGWTWVIGDGSYLGQGVLQLETYNTSGVMERPPQNFKFECLLMGAIG